MADVDMDRPRRFLERGQAGSHRRGGKWVNGFSTPVNGLYGYDSDFIGLLEFDGLIQSFHTDSDETFSIVNRHSTYFRS